MKMKFASPHNGQGRGLRLGLLAPLALLLASLAASCYSYSDAKRRIADDLNTAVIALANENRELWTRQDTIAALRQMHLATHQPVICPATYANFKIPSLKDNAFFAIALVDDKDDAPMIQGEKIASDSVLLMAGVQANGAAVRVQGFAHCSMASIFSASDQSMPGFLLALSFFSLATMFVWKRRLTPQAEAKTVEAKDPISIDGIRLTPMQRRFTQMLLDAPGHKVDKATLRAALWDSKSNADESLYTLVRRTKAALSESNIEIACNRGDSYELHITN